MVQIDDVKMWEFLYRHCYEPREAACILDALKDQGLTIEGGHIISMADANADFKIEKDKWFVCTSYNFSEFADGRRYVFEEGKMYTGKQLLEGGVTAQVVFYHFRPATEEEIKAYQISSAPQRDNYNEIKQVDSEELTEFEKEVRSVLIDWSSCTIDKKPENGLRGTIKKLGATFRKQIVDEINVDEMADEYAAKNYHLSSNFALPLYRQGIEDVLNKIKEG